MTLDAVIFDIDGTLIDSNPAHVNAWVAAFDQLGYRVRPERVTAETGKGGDQLVPSILGRAAEEKDGDALRDRQMKEFLRIAGRTRLEIFPGAVELIAELRRRGLRTALATSSGEEHLDGLFASAGTDFRTLVDESTNADDAESSKPAPDIVVAAVLKLGLAPAQCAMVGDTVFDTEAARGAGVGSLGVLSGGNDAATLMRAGALGVWADVGALLADLDRVLQMAARPSLSPGART